MTDLDKLLDALVPDGAVVSFREFVTSADYCGTNEIYEFWLEEMSHLEDPSELLLDGSLGCGKTTVANYYILYRLYKLFCRPNLHKDLGMSPESVIFILYFSVSLRTAKLSGFQHLINLVDSCKWFTKHFPRDKSIDSAIKFPNNFQILYASSEGHQISLNVIGFILDEANFRKGVGLGLSAEYQEVANLYQQLLDRQITRFVRPDGSLSIAILISSASYQSSFVEKRKQMIKKMKSAACITSVSYKVKPWNYSKETFEVFIGTGTINPQIIRSEEHKASIVRQLSLEGMSDTYERYFEKVPVNIKDSYEANTALALQNHSGVPTQIEGRFIQNMQLVRDALYEPKNQWFPQSQVTISNQDDFQLYELVDLSKIEYPERPHALFLDLSVSGDSGGLSCHRNDSVDDINRFYTHVFLLEIIPPAKPAETRITKVLDFVLWLSQHVNIEVFASDQYQCLDGSTPIPTSEGVKKIADLKIGDTVFSHSGPCQVKNKFEYLNASVVKTTTTSGREYIHTPNHKWSTVRWEKVEGSAPRLVHEFKPVSVGDSLEMLNQDLLLEFLQGTKRKTFEFIDRNEVDLVLRQEVLENRPVYDIEVSSPDNSYYTVDFLTHNSKSVRQEVNVLLGLEDTRFSIDSSDEFHIHWLRSLVEKRSNILKVPKLITECEEAVHNLKSRRVVRGNDSTDDLFQSVVGSYFACSMYTQRDEVDLASLRRNIVGANSVRNVLRSLDYK